MNITKAIAKQVAKKMVKPISESISNEIDTLNEVVKNIAVRNIPKQVYDTYTRHFLKFFTAPSCYSSRKKTFLLSHVIYAHTWFYQFHIRIVLFYETYHFRWVHACKVHVSLEFHPPLYSKMIESLRIFPTRKCQIKSIFGVHPQGHLFTLAKKVDGIFYFFI